MKISNCTIKNNTAQYNGGAFSIDTGNFTVTDSNFINNTANSVGGVIYINNMCNVTIKNSNLINNTANDDGGVLRMINGTVDINGSNFTNNIASKGGAISISLGSIMINNSNFINNNATYGGAIILGFYDQVFTHGWVGFGNITINHSNFTCNNATQGGVIYLNNGTVSVNASNFTNNTAIQEGGAIHIVNGNLTVNTSNFKNNNASIGGVIYTDIGTVSVNGSNFTFNNATQGGVISIGNNGNINLNSSNFINNSVSVSGAVIYISTGTVFVNGSDLTGNKAIQGGAIYMYGIGNITVKNSKLKNNTGEYGGAIFISNKGTVFVNGSDLTGNKAIYGGVILLNSGNINISSSNLTCNNASYGGAIMIGIYIENVWYGSGNVYCINSNFTGNNATQGGVIFLNNGTANFNGSNFTGNNASFGGVIFLNNGTVNFNDSNFTGNNATDFGGVIIINFGNATIIHSTFTNNQANCGGAIRIYTGNLITFNSNFTDNNASLGGAICIGYFDGAYTYSGAGNLTCINSTFVNNTANNGGAILISNCSLNSSINTSNFINNSVSEYGGAIFLVTGDIKINNSNFITNNATQYGAAIYLRISNITINNSNFNKNNASSGGAINLRTGDMVVNNSNFTSNYAINGGVLCLSEESNLEVTGSIFKYNTGSDVGGVLVLDSTGNITVNNSVFIKNYGAWGGVIYSPFAGVNLTHCVLINNSAEVGQIFYASNFVDISNNWWGVNNPSFISDKLIYNGTEDEGEYIAPNSHVILKLILDTDHVFISASVNVNVEFLNNETNEIVYIPERVLSLTCTNGDINPKKTILNNEIISTYTSGNTNGEATIYANIDSQISNITFNVETPVSPVNPTGTILVGENITCHPGNLNYTVTLKTVNGSVLGNESVLFILYNGEYHPVTTDKDGLATITLSNLTLGSYSIRYVYMGNNLYASSNGESTITVVSSNVKVDPSLNVTYNDTSKLLSFNLTGNGVPLSGENITVNIKGNNFTITTGKDGLASINLTSYPSDNYNITYTFPGDDEFNGVNGSISINVSNKGILATILSLNNFTEFYTEGLNLTGRLTDLEGNPLIGEHIALNLSNPRNGLSKIYWVTTDTTGEYQLPINLFAGDYGVNASFNGDSRNNTQYLTSVLNNDVITYLASKPVNETIIVNKDKTVLTADKFNETYNAGFNFTGKLLDTFGKPIVGEHIALNLSNPRNGLSKIYWVTTDTMGEYQLAINLFAGEYLAQCSYPGSEEYLSSNASTTISVTS